jgi:hypothetical protein
VKHAELKKHESSLLTQVRTGKAGLRAFLFQRRVPVVTTPLCQCGREAETPVHIALFCTILEADRQRLMELLAPNPPQTPHDFAAATADPTRTKTVVQWLLSLCRFPEFRLARSYIEIQDWEDAAEGAVR